MGKIIQKIPGVNQLGKKGMSLLAKKLNIAKTTAVKFSKTEMEVLNQLAKNDKFVKQQIEMFLKTGIIKNSKQIAGMPLRIQAYPSQQGTHHFSTPQWQLL